MFIDSHPGSRSGGNVAGITELQLQHFQLLQHFAVEDCPSHGERSPTGASNPDGTAAICDNSPPASYEQS
jgi:hypothetical protein